MAIALDANTPGQLTTGTSFSWTHTPVGTPTLVVVSGGGTAGTNHITDITYGGVSMFANSVIQLNATAGLAGIIYYLFNPPAGAQSVVITRTIGAGEFLTSTTYTGSGTIGNTNTGQDNTNASSLAVNVTAQAATSWLLTAFIGNVGVPTSVTGGSATWADRNASGTVPNHTTYDSDGTVTSGSDTVTVTWAVGQNGIAMAVAEILVPAAAGGATRDARALSLLGVG